MERNHKMTIKEFNQLSTEDAKAEIFKCCGCTYWATKLVDNRPFASSDDLKVTSDTVWISAEEKDWKEAFTHHPKIGDMDSLKKKFATTAGWASGEQGAVAEASEETLQALAKGNEDYEKKFGFIFIVCATGKSAEEMLELLQERLSNDIEHEMVIAMDEQNKITQIRLQKLLS